jgi:amino-acid N-acetyltransferase
MELRIEPAHPDDLPAIVSLLEHSGLPRAEIEQHLDAAVVVRDGTRLVGSAAVELYGAAGLLRSVAVAAEQRGQGLGRRLTNAALELARRRGVRHLYLLTETAAEFFPRFGFRTIPRTAVAPTVQQSIEFTRACSASALAMVTEL